MLFSWLKYLSQRMSSMKMRLNFMNRAHDEQHHSMTFNDHYEMSSSSSTHHLLHIVLYLGLCSCFAITISSMCITSNDDMPWTLHVIAASSFFVLCLIAQAITTYKCYKMYYQLEELKKSSEETIQSEAGDIVFISKTSLYLKIAISVTSFLMLAVNIFSSVLKGAEEKQGFLSSMINGEEKETFGSTISNIVEWTCTLLIILYNITFAMDWSSAELTTNVAEMVQPKLNRQSARSEQVPVENVGLLHREHSIEMNHFPVDHQTMTPPFVPAQKVYCFTAPTYQAQYTNGVPTHYNI